MHCILENLIPALSRTFRHRFKNFQGPCDFAPFALLCKDFPGLKNLKKNSRTFKDPQEPCWTFKTKIKSLWFKIRQSIKDLTPRQSQRLNTKTPATLHV